jgi:hypothetical protein
MSRNILEIVLFFIFIYYTINEVSKIFTIS